MLKALQPSKSPLVWTKDMKQRLTRVDKELTAITA